MNVFELDQALVNDYERFARSFTLIRAPDIEHQVEALYASDRFWPEPLISINPRFERGASIDQLVAAGSLHDSAAQIFSIDGKPLSLYRHQAQAVAKATAGQSFVVTTGTGSGKSLRFFIPIIDAAIRSRASGEPARTRATVIYPMNALANSQREEIANLSNIRIAGPLAADICLLHRARKLRRARANSRGKTRYPTHQFHDARTVDDAAERT
jgi:ATP-dependent helicase YprA (DUF1998 family)